MPRETRLTEAVQKKIVASLKKGNFFLVACEFSGIPESTGREWLSRGLGNAGNRDNREPYASFADAVKRAEAEAEQAAIARIQQAARGKKYCTTKTKEAVNPKTGEIETLTETTEGSEYCWQADAWFLERKFPHRWGRNRMDTLEALKTLADAGWIPVEILEAAADEMSDVRAKVQQAFRQVGKVQQETAQFPLEDLVELN